MKSSFKRAKRTGKYWDLAQQTVECLRCAEFFDWLKSEKGVDTVVSTLFRERAKCDPRFAREYVPGRGRKRTNIHVVVFNMRHRPDAVIGKKDGTALEIKTVCNTSQLRAAIAQAFLYRTRYRFVVMCLVDRTRKKSLLASALDRKSEGYKLLKNLAELSIFTIVGPRPAGRTNGYNHVVFMPRSDGEV